MTMRDLTERAELLAKNTAQAKEIERLTTEASELKETISILTQLNEQKTDDRYDDWAFSEDGYMRRGKALRVENERLQARVEALANFNPDWDMLEATQESLREHMQIIRKLNDGIEGLTRANEALIETNKELTTEAREAFAAGFKARHETPDINRAWEDWYTRQNTEQGESDE